MRGYHTTVPVMAEYAYDHLGRVTDIAAGAGVDFHYDYVANENNIWKKRFDHRNGSPYNEYGYDDIDRLTRADYLKGLTTEYEAFNLDDLGNRQSTTLRDGSGDTYAVDALTNRYDSIDSVGLDYDAAGNLTQDKDGYVYGYDYENRIVEIRNSADGLIAQMDYDTQGRRIRVHDAAAGTETLYYYSDQWQVLAEYAPSGTQQAYYVYGNYIDEVLLMHRAGADLFYLHDHLYSPAALLNSAGTIVERYEYDAYGKVSILASDFSPLSSSQFGNMLLFQGHYAMALVDNDIELLSWRYRDYCFSLAKMMQPDGNGMTPNANKAVNRFRPQSQYNDGVNTYVFVQSNPTNKMDAFGLSVEGRTYCDPEIGAPFIEILLDASHCAEIPTAAHEEVHYEQYKPCCALASKCHKKYGGYSACMIAYYLWHEENKPFHEKEAYKRSASVANDLYNMAKNGSKLPNQGNCTCLSYRDIYLNDITQALNYERESRGRTEMTCPFTQEGDIDFPLLIQRGFGDEIGKWL